MRAAAARAVLLVIALVPPASAQGWTTEARFGRHAFDLSPTGAPSSTTLSFGLGAAQGDSRFGLSAGVPMGAEEPWWGATDLRDRSELELGAVTIGVETAGQGFVQRYARSVETPGGPLQPPTLTEDVTWGWGVAAQVLPFVGASVGAIDLEARLGGSIYRTGLGDRSASRAVLLGDVRAATMISDRTVLSGEARRFAAEDGQWTYAGVGVAGTFNAVDAWVKAGRWLGADANTPWAGGASLRLGHATDLFFEARRDILDPLYGSTARESWTLGVRVGLGEPDVEVEEPVPAGYDGRTATIALDARQAGESPRIAGDFNGWTPEPMTRAGGRWVWRGALEPGVYEYAFVDADGEWFVPASVPGRKDDGMGGHVALLIVEEPGS